MEQFSCCSNWVYCCIKGKCIKDDKEFEESCNTARYLKQGVNHLFRGNLLLIDGNSLLHRAFHAYPPMSSADGTPTNAIFGTLKILEKLMSRFKPSHLLFCLDSSRTTFRNQLYPQYKAKRKEPDEQLVPQFKVIRDVLKALNIPYLEHENYEADDLLGTIALKATGFMTRIATGDKDLVQLINQRINVILSRHGGEHWELTPDNTEEKLGFSPGQVIDFKALHGDTSDNIPGLPGVGDVTALKLLGQYGSLDNIIQNASAIPGKLGDKIRSCVEEVRLYRTLATINCECPVDVDFERYKIRIDKLTGEFKLQSLGIRAVNIARLIPDNPQINNTPPKTEEPQKLNIEEITIETKYVQPSLF